MQIVIDIPEEIYNSACATNNIWDMRMAGFVCSAIANGTQLPKGHGRLIDVNSVYQIVRPIETSDAEWGMTAETAKQIIHDVFKKAPTIIEADKAESEG